MAAVLFEDIFEVLVVDPDGKRFDKGTIMPPKSTEGPCPSQVSSPESLYRKFHCRC